MAKHWALYAALLLASWGIWSGLQAQQDASEQPQGLEQRVEALDGRLAAVEEWLAPPRSRSLAELPPTLDARLTRIENRLDRLEGQAGRYRPGAPASGLQIESRLAALERTVARLSNR